MRIFKKKKPLVIEAIEAREVETVQLWEVTWKRRLRDGYESHGAVRTEYEVFFSEEEADQFCEDLKKAHKVLRHYGDPEAKVTKK